MFNRLTARLAALLLALLAWPAFAQNLVSDQDPLSSLAEDDVSYWVDDVGAYDGKVDLSVLRSEIQERIHGANLQTGTTYELVLSDAGKVVELTNAAAITLTIPANASVAFPINTVIQIVQGGAGAVTIGITSDTLNGATSISTQWDSVLLWKRAATEWVSTQGLTTSGTDADAIHDNVAGEIAAITEKTAVVGADLLLIEDSEDSNNKKRATATNAVESVVSGPQQWWFASDHDIRAGSSTPGTITNGPNDIRVLQHTAGLFQDSAFSVVMPGRWDEGTFRYRVYWITSNTNTGTVTWALYSISMADGDPLPSTRNLEVSLNDSGQGVSNDSLITPWSSSFTVSGAVAGDLIHFGHARSDGDSYTGTAHMVGLQLEWTSNASTD